MLVYDTFIRVSMFAIVDHRMHLKCSYKCCYMVTLQRVKRAPWLWSFLDCFNLL